MKKIHSIHVALLTVLLAVCVASRAGAFPHLYFWGDPANGVPPNSSPGAGNIYGTGGARDFGVTCAMCHYKAAGLIDASVTPAPAWQNVAGSLAYKPGQVYTITVALLNEQKIPAAPATNNLNGFALTIEDQSGNGAGSFATDAVTPVTTANCTNTRILGTAEANLVASAATTYMIASTAAGGGCYTVTFIPKLNTTTWTFKWTAPAAGKGPVTIYYGVVDGDTNGKNSSGDDVKQGVIKINEGA